MRKIVIRYLVVLAVLAGGAAAFLYAQRGYIFKSNEAGKQPETTEEQTEDIGQPTNDNPWKEMEKLVDAYYDERGVTFRGVVKLIDDNGENEKVLEEHPFEYAVVKDNFYYSLDKMEIVHNNNIALVADNNNRLISVSDQKSTESKQQKFFDIGEFKEMMKERKAEARVTQLGNEKILTIENIQDPQVQGYRIYYNPSTYKISRMLIGMVRFSPLDDDEEEQVYERKGEEGKNESPADDNATLAEESEQPVDTYTYYLEIIYKESAPMNLTSSDFHPENKFIRKNGDKTELTAAYSNYQLILNSQEPEEKKTTENSEEQ